MAARQQWRSAGSMNRAARPDILILVRDRPEAQAYENQVRRKPVAPQIWEDIPRDLSYLRKPRERLVVRHQRLGRARRDYRLWVAVCRTLLLRKEGSPWATA